MTHSTSLIQWLLTDARAAGSAEELLNQLAPRLIEAGIPLWRSTFHLPQFHPQLYGLTYEWRSDVGRASERRFLRQNVARTGYFHSPVALLHRMQRTVRRRLAGADAELDFPVLEELAGEGATDYVLVPLEVGAERVGGFSVASRTSAGIDHDHIVLLEEISGALGAICEIFLAREKTRGLLETYVGRHATNRILEGQIVLGGGSSIEAVILFCDMRNFTRHSESLSSPELLELLNSFFDSVVTSVHKREGEVLKYLGDGLLAIFPLGRDEPRDEACARAMIAAMEAVALLDQVNEVRRAEGKMEARGSFALHIGTVHYGNIGAANRFDFTVIGSAVNLASRIEALCSQLDHRVLMSETFAQSSPVQLVSVGRHALKGLDGEQEIFAPALKAFPDQKGGTRADRLFEGG